MGESITKLFFKAEYAYYGRQEGAGTLGFFKKKISIEMKKEI
jgi:hypothetical protein